MRLLRSFRCALAGIAYCLRTQPNFRIHCGILLLVILCGWLAGLSMLEWCAICICASLVLLLEMVNTAVEYLCDQVTTAIHPAIRIIKDVMAGAVLVSTIGSAITGLLIFIPKLTRYFL